MAVACQRCGNTENVAKFCPVCGASQAVSLVMSQAGEQVDPLVGRVLCDRYEIIELLNVGGMGRVYRALHKILDRTVAIKVIHPHLLTSEEIVARFMVEARTVSKLNHPNVVQIHDFGRTGPEDGLLFFLVMELLTGPDLANVLENEPPMPLARVANILRQVLAALSEAHALGIVHRDIKPENISLERTRSEEDHVKVIDFGIAKVDTDRRLTRAGMLLGTPHFMAPELISGKSAGPSVDLYAVGIMLFQMLTGQVPFDHDNTTTILQEHLYSERPDPRTVAPGRSIPPMMAEVCLRSIAVDPDKRYPDAKSLAEAIVRASASGRLSMHSVARTSQLARTETNLAALGPRPITAQSIAPSPLPYKRSASPAQSELPLVGVEGVIEEIESTFPASSQYWGASIVGASSMGRTRLLKVIAERNEANWVVFDPITPMPPRNEVSFSLLRAVVSKLLGMRATDPGLASGRLSDDLEIMDGMRTIFSPEIAPAAAGPNHSRRCAVRALRWAMERALVANENRPILILIDDIDEADSISRSLMLDLFASAQMPLVRVVCTTKSQLPTATDSLLNTKLHGFGSEQIGQLVAVVGEVASWPLQVKEVSPLFLDLLWRWETALQRIEIPTDLAELVRWRFTKVPVDSRRAMAAIALLGGGSPAMVASVLQQEGAIDGALRPLESVGFIRLRNGTIRVQNAVFARVAESLLTESERRQLHVQAARSLRERPDLLELRAFHQIRGNPGFDAFLALEECARVRLLRGDHDGAIHALWDGVQFARAEMASGDDTAVGAAIVFGRKLGEAMIRVRRAEEAIGVLSEALTLTAPRELGRALVLEQLSIAYADRGRVNDAIRQLNDAIRIATDSKEGALLSRLEGLRGSLESMSERAAVVAGR